MYGTIAFGAAAGLGLFLYGMHLMGAGLQKAAGERLKSIIEMLTKNKYIAVLIGTIVTAIIQSSSATTVMVVGFVNAGIMTLNQAIGVIMGANIGTTMTAQLVSFNLEAIAPIAVAIGMVLYITAKNPKVKDYAEILIGFGILFVGMVYMKDAVKPLKDVKEFNDMILSFGQNPILGIVVGFFLTLLLQSSSASIGILVALAADGMLPLSSALPILYGDNIGTCTTALFASIGATKNAQRAAVMHLSFNIIGTIIFVAILNYPIMYIVEQMNPDSVARQIANAHTLFNFTNVIVQLPFSSLLVKIAEKLVVGEDNLDLEARATKLDKLMLGTPSIAVESAFNECVIMGEVTLGSYKNALKGFLERDIDSLNATFKAEKIINKMEHEIMDYLVSVSNTDLSKAERERVDRLFNIINDIERIGDHSENIAELGQSYINVKHSFSEESRIELDEMIATVTEALNLSLEALKTKERRIANRVLELEDEVDRLEKSNREKHIIRLNNNLCKTETGILFLDLISNLERISDHASNIAEFVIKAIEQRNNTN